MAIETSMYAAPPQGNNLVDMLRLFSALGNNTNDPNQNRLMGTSGGGSYAGAGGTSGAMYASVPKDRGPVAATVADELRANGLSDNGIRGVLANVQDESGFDPTMRVKDQPHWSGEAAYAHGLYQEGAGEWNHYSQWLQQNAPNADWRDARLQTRFLAQNLQQNYPDTWKSMHEGTPEQAAQAFVGGYLKPRADYAAARSAKYAQGIPPLEAFAGQQKTAMATPSTATDAAPAGPPPALPPTAGVGVTPDQYALTPEQQAVFARTGVTQAAPTPQPGPQPADALSAKHKDIFARTGVTQETLNSGAPATAAPATATPSTDKQTYMDARNPSLAERIADWTGMSPQYWQERVETAKAPVRFLQGAEAPFQGTVQAIPHAAAWAASAGGRSPNAISQFLTDTATRNDARLSAEAEPRDTERQAAGNEPGATDWARTAGNIASPMNFATAKALAPSAGANVLTRFMRAPITGAAIGAEQPVTSGNYAEEKQKQAEGGAIAGLVGEGIATGVQPWVGSDAAKMLLDRGVPLTPGQMTGGMLKGVEDKAASIPFVGDLIKARQRDALLGFNRSNLDDMLGDIGQKLPDNVSAGTESLDTALKLWKTDREALLAKSQGRLDQPLTQDITAIRAGKDPVSGEESFLPAAQLERVNHLADRVQNLDAKYPNGIPAKEVTGMSSALDAEARGLANNPDHYQRQLGGAVDDLAKSWDRMVARQNPDIAPKLADSDRAYAKWVRIRDAAGGQGATEGVYTPQGFATSVSRNATTKNQKATGNALMQDVAQAGKSVLPSSVPNSGTADRAALIETLLALGGGAGGHAMGLPLGAMAAGPAAAALYSKPGQAAARWLASAGYGPRDALGRAIRNYGAPMGIPASNALAPYMQPSGQR